VLYLLNDLLFNSPFSIQKDIQPLIDGHFGQLQSIIDLHEFFGPKGERGVHFRVALIWT